MKTEEEPIADEVAIYGMFDCHLCYRFEGKTIEEVVNNWQEFNSKPIPAKVGDQDVEDIGPCVLGPAIVLSQSKELRRVGPMVHIPLGKRQAKLADVDAYVKALKEDPDIPRIIGNPPGPLTVEMVKEAFQDFTRGISGNFPYGRLTRALNAKLRPVLYPIKKDHERE